LLLHYEILKATNYRNENPEKENFIWHCLSYCFTHFMVGCIALWVFNTIFNVILVVFWQLVLSVEETGVPSENHQPATSYW